MQLISKEVLDQFLVKRGNMVFIDVRESYEFANKKIEGFVNIPFSGILTVAEFIDRPLVLICRSGARAKVAAMQIEEKFPNAQIFVLDENILE